MATKGNQYLKLLQLNCWGGKLGTQLCRLIEAEQPDIVCLQEATDLSARPGSVLDPYSKFLPENLYPNVLFAPIFSYRYMHELAGLGNAIVSKIPFDKTNVQFLLNSFKKDIESANSEDYNNRNFAHAVNSIRGQGVNIITHHGHHHPDSKNGSEENTRQMTELASYIAKLSGPTILAGDFNLHPDSKSLKPIHDLLENLCTTYGVISTRSELAKRQEVIDYIFVSKGVNVKNFYVAEMVVSDHSALILEFDL
jgi:endonuclease/exonuclease/phosphatase family metal-dependent hydrolase